MSLGFSLWLRKEEYNHDKLLIFVRFEHWRTANISTNRTTQYFQWHIPTSCQKSKSSVQRFVEISVGNLSNSKYVWGTTGHIGIADIMDFNTSADVIDPFATLDGALVLAQHITEYHACGRTFSVKLDSSLDHRLEIVLIMSTVKTNNSRPKH